MPLFSYAACSSAFRICGKIIVLQCLWQNVTVVLQDKMTHVEVVVRSARQGAQSSPGELALVGAAAPTASLVYALTTKFEEYQNHQVRPQR